ncbi:MAG: potassium transporter TrkG [Phycisphaerae bacterium]
MSGKFLVTFLNVFAALLGLSVLVLEYGFIRPGDETGFAVNTPPLSIYLIFVMKYLAVVGFIVGLGSQLNLRSDLRSFLKEHLVELALSAAAAIGLILILAGRQTENLNLALTVYLLIQILILFGKFISWFFVSLFHPVRTIIIGYFSLITCGALLLCLPAASFSDRFSDFGNNFSDHFFTATSAVCLAGLTVRNIATDYTPFGQLVVLLLVQIGGLGILTLGTIFIARRRATVRIGNIIKQVIIAALVLETIGAILMYGMWDTPSIPEKIFKSYFHAASAFCNAGFTLQSDNLISLAWRWQTYGVILPLAIIGGLGICALVNLPFQRRIVLVSSGLLILIGASAIFAIETPRTRNRWGRNVQYEDVVVKSDPALMRNHNGWQRMLDALFLSTTARTSGFTTVDTTTGKLHPATLTLLMGLMFIGGSPASTAGGIKTVTFVILLATVTAAIKKKTDTTIFHQTIESKIIRQAVVLLLIYGAMVWTITISLVFIHPQLSFLDLLFEAASACGCVGLSTGITSQLSLSGRIILMLGIFAGRLGPLALLYSLTKESQNVMMS